MKQTFGNKIKRLAVAMFAALCVGNVWADEEGRTTYTWTGAADNIWANAANWTYEGDSKLGYPGIASQWGYYLSKICFNSNAEVDLDEGKYFLWDNNRGIEMSEGITVKLKNGTLGLQPHNDGNPVTLDLGKKNSILHLKDVEMPYNQLEEYDGNDEYNVKLVADSTVVMEGYQEYIWKFLPGNV